MDVAWFAFRGDRHTLATCVLQKLLGAGVLFMTHAFVKHTCSDRNHKGNVQPIWRQAAGKFRQLVNNVTVFYVVIRCVRCA